MKAAQTQTSEISGKRQQETNTRISPNSKTTLKEHWKN